MYVGKLMSVLVILNINYSKILNCLIHYNENVKIKIFVSVTREKKNRMLKVIKLSITTLKFHNLLLIVLFQYIIYIYIIYIYYIYIYYIYIYYIYIYILYIYYIYIYYIYIYIYKHVFR